MRLGTFLGVSLAMKHRRYIRDVPWSLILGLGDRPLKNQFGSPPLFPYHMKIFCIDYLENKHRNVDKINQLC